MTTSNSTNQNNSEAPSHCGSKPKKIAFGIAPLGFISIGIVPMGTIPMEMNPSGAIPNAIFFGLLPQCEGASELF